MAFTEIEGTITRTFYQGKGAELTETFKTREGSEGKKVWSMWFKSPHGLAEGDSGKFRGSHADKVDEWEKDGEKRHTIKRSINNAISIEGGVRSAPAAEPWATAPAADTAAAAFPAPAGFDFPDDTPF